MSMNQIADDVGIVKSTVFRIVQEASKQDPDLVLIRVLSVNLGKTGLEVGEYADIIRAANLLKEEGLDPAIIYQSISDLVSMSYRLGISGSELVELADHLRMIINGMRFNNLRQLVAWTDRKVEREKYLLSRLMEERKKLEQEHENLRKANLPLYQVEEYYRQLDWERTAQIESLQVDWEIASAHTLDDVKIDQLELDKLENELGITIDEAQVKSKISQILKHPSKHPMLFYPDELVKVAPTKGSG